MELDRTVSRIFLPDDTSWLKHANPWSVWTRFATLPFIILAIWSRVWMGWYFLIPLSVLVFWIFINPTLFKQPKNFDSWAAKAVLGERMLMKRKEHPIPINHKNLFAILNIIQAVGVCILAYGLFDLSIHLTLHGMTIVYLAKMWFLDRMVWLYEDMSKDRA